MARTNRRIAAMLFCAGIAAVAVDPSVLHAQVTVTPDQPLVIGRDPSETSEIIGKNFQLRIWMSNIAGPGMQQIKTVRLGTDGNISLPGLAPIHAEGTAVAGLEFAVNTAYKPVFPAATVWITIVDRPAPPPPPPPPAPPAPPPAPVAPPPPPPAPAATKPAATQPAAATTAPATKPVATQPAATTSPATKPAAPPPAATTAPAAAPATKPA